MEIIISFIKEKLKDFYSYIIKLIKEELEDFYYYIHYEFL